MLSDQRINAYIRIISFLWCSLMLDAGFREPGCVGDHFQIFVLDSFVLCWSSYPAHWIAKPECIDMAFQNLWHELCSDL